MSFIKINIAQLTNDMLYYFLRKVRNLDWHKIMSNQVKFSYDRILAIRQKNLFLSNHTSQKISFEHLLNNIVDGNGNKIIVGSPVTCVTTGNFPIFWHWTDAEIDNGKVPENVVGVYTYKEQQVNYKPLEPLSWTDAELYDANGEIKIDYSLVAWNTTESDRGENNSYTIFVDAIDFVGLQGVDDDGKQIYAPGSKLDIIDKYAQQYTAIGCTYNITQR